MLVKFRCGCIGFPDKREDGKVLLVRACDTQDGDEFGLFWRDLNPENYANEPVSVIAEYAFLTELGRLINEGYRFRALKGLLT